MNNQINKVGTKIPSRKILKPKATVSGYVIRRNTTAKSMMLTVANSDMYYSVCVPLDVDVSNIWNIEVTGDLYVNYDKEKNTQKTMVLINHYTPGHSVKKLKVRDRDTIFSESENLLLKNVKFYKQKPAP